LKISDFSSFTAGVVLMVFIYWGWDTAVAVNEGSKDKTKTPGRAAIIFTLIVLVTCPLVITSVQAFAGVGATGNGLGNPDDFGDVLSVQGNAIFGGSGFGLFLLGCCS
jgi:amino acid transporter